MRGRREEAFKQRLPHGHGGIEINHDKEGTDDKHNDDDDHRIKENNKNSTGDSGDRNWSRSCAKSGAACGATSGDADPA